MNQDERDDALRRAATHASPYVAALLRSIAKEGPRRTLADREPKPHTSRMTQLPLFKDTP